MLCVYDKSVKAVKWSTLGHIIKNLRVFGVLEKEILFYHFVVFHSLAYTLLRSLWLRSQHCDNSVLSWYYSMPQSVHSIYHHIKLDIFSEYLWIPRNSCLKSIDLNSLKFIWIATARTHCIVSSKRKKSQRIRSRSQFGVCTFFFRNSKQWVACRATQFKSFYRWKLKQMR